ncbi:MAG TPA: ATP-dependent DNA ligase [Candidatus Nanoarchaeia archaeon]|nr:ATP-dependent DNA ligase [Candidatus Nanoarchaeia archaeon]
MQYSILVNFYKSLGKTTKRLEKTDILASLLKSADEDLEKIVYLVQGKVFPLWDDSKIGFSSRLVMKAISSVTGSSINEIEKLFNKEGDLGKVASILITKKKQSTLFSQEITVSKVFNNIRKLSTLEGEGTVNRKVQLVSELLSNASPDEAKFIIGTVLEELRIGIAAGIVRDSISKAFDISVEEVENAYDLLTDYGLVAKLAKQKKLHEVKLEPGKPINLMLAILAKNIEEGFEIVGKPAEIEFKYDGFRMQIHKKGNEIKLLTRRMEDVTKQFPELVPIIKSQVKADSVILDSEVVGYDKKTGKYLPFQSISQRIRRKYDIEEMGKKFPVEVNVFDVLFLNGKSLFNEQLLERRKILEKIVKPIDKKIVLAKNLITDSAKEVETFYKSALKAGHEGIMFKSITASYKPGRYVGFMAKLKEVLETLDLVIVKAEWGEGKRAKWLSSYTVACKDSDGNLVEVGKVSTGVKEKGENEVTFEQITKELKPLIISEKSKEVTLHPSLVVEVAFEEIQKSPSYSSGYAMRFPRFLRVRFDRSLDDISDINLIEKIYNSQRGKK